MPGHGRSVPRNAALAFCTHRTHTWADEGQQARHVLSQTFLWDLYAARASSAVCCLASRNELPCCYCAPAQDCITHLTTTLELQGAPGQALTAADMQGMEVFLSAANPRVRALGGTRFNGASQPSPEWQAFGSFCFMIPRLELLEAAGCCLLSCTLAWKPQLDPQDRYLRPLLFREGSRHLPLPSGCPDLCLRRLES